MKCNALILLLIAGLAACSDKTPVPQYQAPAAPAVQAVAAQPAAAPVIINQAPAAAPHSGVGDMLMGGAMGYMLGSAGNRGGNNASHATVNRTTVIKKTVVVQAAPKPAKPYSAPKSAPARSSYKSSFSSSRSGGRR